MCVGGCVLCGSPAGNTPAPAQDHGPAAPGPPEPPLHTHLLLLGAGAGPDAPAEHEGCACCGMCWLSRPEDQVSG